MKSMNVVQNEKLLRPPTKQDDAKPPGRLAAAAAAAPPPPAPPPPLTKYHFEFDKNLRTQRRSASCWKSSARSPNRRDSGRGRASTSSFLADGSSRNCISRSGTRSTTAAISSSAFETASNILAITTGRGEARTEVGMAALDTRCSCLILCQISDSQTYANALSKLHLFDPMEVLMPDTMCERTAGRSVLYCSIVCKFSYLRVTPISRIHFNDANGLERIRTLCAAEYSSVELFVKEKYYALAAAAALLKYVEYAQRIVYAPKSMKIEFQGSPNATVIDLESARSLELVRSQCGQRNVSLLGILDACSTPMGRKLLRASILQPPCQESIILERQSSVAELVSDRSLRDLLQPIVRRLHGADRLVALSTTPVLLENTVQCAEQNLNYALLLKNLLDVVPELEAILSAGESDVLRRIRRNLQNPRFRSMKEKILERIHPDARSVTGYTSSNMQRCFAIKAGINDLLDVARQTYCELIDDMKSMVENLACKYELTLSLGCNASLGYHIQAVFPRDRNSDTFDPPAEFVEVRKGRRVCTMTTGTLSTLSQQCKIASEELHLMSNVLLSDLLQEIRGYIGCLFQLSADVAELDLIISLARVSSIQTYVRPTFGRKLELHDSRHPVLEAFGFDNPVPNDVNASIPWNFYVITGPNMSGKSTYLKQIVLLHIMAQIGCFVPAKKATFRLTDLIFCKIAVRDDIECNASTFTLEMKEAQYILRSVTPISLIVLDELCKGTTIEEGASIAWAICEQLLNTTAFVFVATHFAYLTKLADVYRNVTNNHFETISARETERDGYRQLTYTHRLKFGVAPTDDYGIVLAELSGLPNFLTEKARKYASERLIVDRVATKSNAYLENTSYRVVVRMYELLETDKFHRDRATDLFRRIADLRDREEDAQMVNRTNQRRINAEEKNKYEYINTADKGDLNATTTGRELETATGIDTDFKRTPNSPTKLTANVLTESLRTRNDILPFHLRPSKRRESSHRSYGSFGSPAPLSPCSKRTRPSNELERRSSTTSNFDAKFFDEFYDSADTLCSVTGRSVSSFSLTHGLSSTRISIATDKSLPTLYEYYLSDDDFEPLEVSPTSVRTDTLPCNRDAVAR